MSTLITCHSNADFDAFASLIGASLFFPEAKILFPGTQEAHLQRYIAEIAEENYTFYSAKDIDFTSITRLVVVDTRQKSRLEHAKPCFDNKNLEVIVWDHHPQTDDDIVADTLYYEEIGATSSLLVHELKAKNIEINKADATLLSIGIHMDTRSFTFDSCTLKDFEAASYLWSLGIDGTQVSHYQQTELTPSHVKALNELLESAETHEILSESIVIATTKSDDYLHDFALLAPKFMEIVSCKVFFALGLMAGKIQILARSNVKTIDVGEICSKFSGGGHSYAAAASIKNMTVGEVKDTIIKEIFMRLNGQIFANKLQSTPVISIDDDKSMNDAYTIMMRFGLKAIPIVKKGSKTCVGWISQEQAARGKVLNELTVDTRVSEYMQKNFQVVSRKANLQEIMDIIVGSRQRLLPVVDTFALDIPQEELKNYPLIGVITRTDIMRLFSDENIILPMPTIAKNSKQKNLAKSLLSTLGDDNVQILKLAGELAEKLSYEVLLVGGFVRDLLIKQSNKQGIDFDLDFVLEGDVSIFAYELAKLINGRVCEHKKFMTATILYNDKNNKSQKIDIATSRLEYYEYPAALPTVEISSIKMDLYRRDFAMNAMAIRLNPNEYGVLVDFFDGQIDIRTKKIRVLHTLSFIEDPTRILRAIRFEQRYKFEIGQQADKLIFNAIDLQLLDKLSGKRIVIELDLIMKEENLFNFFKRLESYNILSAIHPLISLDTLEESFVESILNYFEWYKKLYFEPKVDGLLLVLLALARTAQIPEFMELIKRLELSPTRTAYFLKIRAEVIALNSQLKVLKNEEKIPSVFYKLFSKVTTETMLYLMAKLEDEEILKSLTLFLLKWRSTKADITGKDLHTLNIPRGEIYKELLDLALFAKLDDENLTREEQLKLVREKYAQLKN